MAPEVAIECKHSVILGEDDVVVKSLFDRVTTPGGITIRSLNAMEEAGFTAAVIAGIVSR